MQLSQNVIYNKGSSSVRSVFHHGIRGVYTFFMTSSSNFLYIILGVRH